MDSADLIFALWWFAAAACLFREARKLWRQWRQPKPPTRQLRPQPARLWAVYAASQQRFHHGRN